jgi:hypothetical protein
MGKSEETPHASAGQCGAKTRKALPCKNLCMSGRRRCRMHGGMSTGPRTADSLERVRRSNWKHGHYSAEAISERRFLRQLLRRSGKTLERIREVT